MGNREKNENEREKIAMKKSVEKMPTNENGKMMLQKMKMAKNFYRVCGYIENEEHPRVEKKGEKMVRKTLS